MNYVSLSVKNSRNIFPENFSGFENSKKTTSPQHFTLFVYLSQAGLEVIEESEAQLWWAGKELKETKLLSDYVGKNEKTTIIVKIQKVSVAGRCLYKLFTFGCLILHRRELSVGV